MRFQSSLLLLFLCFVFLGVVSARAEDPSPATSDLMCANAPAGSVEKLPAPFNLWMVVVCAPQSQALVPVEGMMWFTHGTADPVSILALPPGVAPVPKTDEYDPGYGVRFKAFFATEAKDKKRERALRLFKEATLRDASPPTLKIDRVYQLDAVSVIYDMRYNIYFYVADKRPRFAIACIEECRKALFFDILTLQEATARIATP